MKTRTLSTIAVAAVVVALAGWATFSNTYTLQSGGRIAIDGTSNVGSWDCETRNFSGSLTANPVQAGFSSVGALVVSVPVAQIDCGNGTMNTNMRNALNASQHAAVRFTLPNAQVTAPSGGRFTVRGNGSLTIAGNTQQTAITAQGQALNNGRVRFTGSVPVTMSRHGIRPPTAMLGTMRTNDAVTVRFDVTVAP
ncbi:hypothetical protein BH23BAC4_BH23BAC4_14150 [soil metagenome]